MCSQQLKYKHNEIYIKDNFDMENKDEISLKICCVFKIKGRTLHHFTIEGVEV